MSKETCRTCKQAGQSDETQKHYCKRNAKEILLWGTCSYWERFKETDI